MKILLFLLLTFFNVSAQEYLVVVSKKCHVKDKISIQKVYLKKQRRVNNCSLEPLNLQANDKIREIFVNEILHISQNRWSRYWDKMHFKGIKSPYIVSSEKAMSAFVTNVEGSVGYIPKEMLQSSMQIVAKFEVK